MRVSAIPRLLLMTVIFACLALPWASIRAQDDPPPQAARLSALNGPVFIQAANADNFGQAYENLPLGPGDRILTDFGARAEIQLGRTWVRLGADTDVSVIEMSPDHITFGLGKGAIRVHCNGLWDDQVLYVQTPSGTATVSHPADLRVRVNPQEPAADFIDNYGSVYISGAGDYGVETQQGQALELAGTNPVYPQWFEQPYPDALDQWSMDRDGMIARASSYRYVSPEIAGAYELDAAGDWTPQSDYGPVWFPHVEAGWAPYRHGHWINRPPWGWVWVEQESWGAAPFHYGRWVTVNGRWGWIPGPPAVHPVWSPALVVFAGGGGGGGGVGLSVWFPLGPGEPYRPWYHCSPRYVDQVNITNITPAPRVVVQRTYVNIVNVTNVTNVTYVNRTVGITAVSHEDFAAGRPVAQASASVHVDVNIIARAPVLAAPPVPVTRAAAFAPPPSHPIQVQVSVVRPMLINARGQAVAAQPHAQAAPPPVRQITPPKPAPGMKVIAQPATARVIPPSQHLTASGKPNPAPEAHPVPAPAESKPAPAPAPKPAPAAQPKPAPAESKPAPAPAPKPAPAAQPKPAPAATPKPAPAAQPKPAPEPKPAPAAQPKPAPAATPKPAPAAQPKPAPEPKPAPAAQSKPGAPAAKPAPKPGEPAAQSSEKPQPNKPAPNDKNKKPSDKKPEPPPEKPQQ